MSTTLSIRLDADVKKRLEALSKSSKRSKSFLAAEAVGAYVDSEEGQLSEIRSGLNDLDEGRTVSHEKVSEWLNSWGGKGGIKSPE